ncbi:MAG: SagB/ThcOx family dehydrogenase [candidate division WOR-3 bacterium]|nr:SagB/ThcOx family dehydrogenase [candidate division WOR-3 bacterium]
MLKNKKIAILLILWLIIVVEAKEVRMKLPKPRFSGSVSVEEAMLKRRSIRSYKDEALTLEEVSQLLWSAQGKTADWGGRTVPSAGATYPLEIYLVVGKVKGLEVGVYRYLSESHELEKIGNKDVRKELTSAALGQEYINNAPISIVISAKYERTTKRYGERGIRYVDNEVGHCGQNIHLQCEALDLGTVVIGAFRDEQVKKVLGIKEEPRYIMPVGKKR